MKIQIRRTFLTLCLVILAFLLQGCWDVKDIDNRLLVTAIGIEQAPDNQIRIWTRFPIPQSPQSSSSGPGKDFFTTKQLGNTVVEAFDSLRLKLPKYLDMSGTRTIFLDQRLAEKGFLPYLEFTIRDRMLPLDTVVALISGDMEPIFTKPNPVGELSGVYTKLFFERYAGGTAQKNMVPLWGLFSGYFNPLEENLVPLLISDPVTLFKLKGNAFFQGDRMIGMLTPEETLIYEIVTNQMTPFEIETAQEMNVKILESEATIHTRMKNNKPVIRIQAKLTMTLMDSAHGITIKPDKLEASINRLLEDRAAKIFEQTQQKKSDIFRLGNHFRGKVPASQFNDWPELYQHATIEFKLDSKLKNTGLQLMRKPFINPPKES